MSSGSNGNKRCSVCGSTAPHLPMGKDSCEWNPKFAQLARDKAKTAEELVKEIGRLSDLNMMLRNALKPFSQDDECGDGFLVGDDDDHTANCHECRCILAARKALEVS